MPEDDLLREFRKDKLAVRIYADAPAAGRAAAGRAAALVNHALARKGEAVVVLATGASQFVFLETLLTLGIDWPRVTAFHLDEYAGMAPRHPASFRRYLRERFVDRVELKSFHEVRGDCADMAAELRRLHELFAANPVDVAFVGIGENGHLAFNDPPADFETRDAFILVDLDDDCRRQQLGEGWFKSLDEVPACAISMTVGAIMKSRSIVCTVPDQRKARAVRETIEREIGPELPATILRRHPDCALFLDRESASLLQA